MPDIGLLQGAPRPRIPALTKLPDDTPATEARVSAAPFFAPVDAAIPVAAMSVPAVLVPIVSVPILSTPTIVSPPIAAAAHAAEAGPRQAPASGPSVPPMNPGPVYNSPPPIRARDLLWLALALLVIVGTGLGVRDPWPADEPRFAVLARDMAHSHEWLFPRVGGDLYQDKPPLFFWLLALCYTIFGSVKASFLVPSFFAAGGILFLVYDYGRRAVSTNAGLAAALITVCTLQFLMVTRGAQIDATLCFLTTLSVYALLRHLLFGAAWRWYFVGGFAAGLGVFTKGVGFLPILLLIPFFALRSAQWRGLATIDAGRGGWRWWLAPLAMVLAISLWFVPMLIAVATSGSTEYAAYRDEILFKQTVGRYAAAWHHVKGWYYFILEVIPLLWLPWSLLLVWLVPRFKAAFRERDARVWLPLLWVFIVVLFFSASPGKRGIYILPALPALAFAAMPFLESLMARAGVRRAGFVLGGAFFIVAAVLAVAHAMAVGFAVDAIAAANLGGATALHVYLALCGAGLAFAYARAPLAAWPVALGSLAIVFSYLIAPAMNGERSGADFVRAVLAKVKPDDELALVAYKEQFLLYVDRPTVNFGHRRSFEGSRESYDAAAWLNAGPDRVALVPARLIDECFSQNATRAGRTSDEDWFLVRAPAVQNCAARGDATRAIRYEPPAR